LGLMPAVPGSCSPVSSRASPGCADVRRRNADHGSASGSGPGSALRPWRCLSRSWNSWARAALLRWIRSRCRSLAQDTVTSSGGLGAARRWAPGSGGCVTTSVPWIVLLGPDLGTGSLPGLALDSWCSRRLRSTLDRGGVLGVIHAELALVVEVQVVL